MDSAPALVEQTTLAWHYPDEFWENTSEAAMLWEEGEQAHSLSYLTQEKIPFRMDLSSKKLSTWCVHIKNKW